MNDRVEWECYEGTGRHSVGECEVPIFYNESDIFVWKDYSLMIESMDSGVRLPGFKSLVALLLAMPSWITYSTYLCLNFIIIKGGKQQYSK